MSPDALTSLGLCTGFAIDRFGAGALWFSAALGLVALAALMLLRDPSSVPARRTV